jgi:hypothetical protein
MASNQDLLFINKFIRDDITEVPVDQANAYRKYIESKRQKMNTETKGKVESVDDKKKQAKIKYIKQKRKLFIDSKDRDKNLYPDASDFVISWGRTFQNVTRLSLNSLEFPNVMQSVSALNNTLSWINLEDVDLEPPFPVYTVSCIPGSYTLDTLNTEMTNLLKIPFRHNGQTDSSGNPAVRHAFIVTTSDDTDAVTFTSIITESSVVDPIRTVANSTTVFFGQADHGYHTGDTIYIIGVVGVIGGLQASDFSGGFEITVIDVDTFSFVVNTPATTDATGGGTLTKCGKQAPYQFLFGDGGHPIADAIGFPVQNSSTSVTAVNPITTMVVPIVTIVPGINVVEIVSPNHGFLIGDSVYLYNFNVTPSIYENVHIKGVFSVASIPSPDVFTIIYNIDHISDVSRAYIGTRIFTMTWPGHGFNRVVDIEPLVTGGTAVTTLFDHGFDPATTTSVRLSGTNSVPSVDGFHRHMVISGSDTVTLPDVTVTTPGFTGILTSDQNFHLYKVIPFGGFSSVDLNGVVFSMRKIISDSQFMFVGRTGFSSSNAVGGGANILINSKIHGWNAIQTNSPNGILNKPVNLAGANYAFMCIPGINSDCIASTGTVKDIFAKLFLTTTPGAVIFNEFDSAPIDFITPLSKLDELRFTIITPDNVQATFNGLDYSFGLDVTEVIPKDDDLDPESTRVVRV